MGRLEDKRNAASQPQPDWLHSVSSDSRRIRVNACAAQQWGVLLRADLLACGLGSETIRSWTRSGHLHHVGRGVYSVAPPAALAPQGRDLAAVWACGDQAVLCSVSAAVRWGMLRYPPPEPQVLIRSSGRRNPPGIDVRVTRHLPSTDSTIHERIPITTVERTVLDLAADSTVSDRALESAAAQAERDGRLRRPAQLRTAARAAHRTGSPRLRAVLRIGPRLWRSDEEALAAAAIVEAGLPEPVIAHEVRTDIGRLEVDLSFPDHRLILEVDGAQHLLVLNGGRDVDRDAALQRAGWRILRVSAADVRERPGHVVALVRAALRVRGHR